MAYRVGVLRTDVSTEADKHNAELLGPNTHGVEVTQPSLAKQCGLGNNDPQHGPDARSESSAIEDSLVLPLLPDGATIVTIREDKDSLGAMGVYAARLDGADDLIDELMVQWIGAVDRHGLAEAKKLYPVLAWKFMHSKEVFAMNYVVYENRTENIGERVSVVSLILCHQLSSDEVCNLANKSVPRRKLDFKREVALYGEVAVIETSGFYHEARIWGNERYKVTVVYDAKNGRFTVVRKSGCFDKMRFDREINKLEAWSRGLTLEELERLGHAWGGNSSITSSPTGNGHQSKLFRDKHLVYQLAYECLESGIVT